jgi:hypothetical protein
MAGAIAIDAQETARNIFQLTLEPGRHVVLHATSDAGDTDTDLYMGPRVLDFAEGGSIELRDSGGTGIDFVSFGNGFIEPSGPDDWRGNTARMPDNTLTQSLGRDPAGSDTNHRTDWAVQSKTLGGQNWAYVVVNEIYPGSTDIIELRNPLFETFDISGWKVIALTTASVRLYTFPDGAHHRSGRVHRAVRSVQEHRHDYAIVVPDIQWSTSNARGVALINSAAVRDDSQVGGMDFVRFGGKTTSLHPAHSGLGPTVSPPQPGAWCDLFSTDTDNGADWITQASSFGRADPVSKAAANSSFNEAVVIPALPFRNTPRTSAATHTSSEPLPGLSDCQGISVDRTVWHQYTAPSVLPASLIFQTNGSDFDTLLSVWKVPRAGMARRRPCRKWPAMTTS